MWFSLLSFLVMGLVLTTISCKKDKDSDSCSQSDWVGTYAGTVTCDGTTEDVTVTITANGSSNIDIKYETGFSSTEIDDLAPSGCSLSRSGSFGGFSSTVNATLDGDKLTFSDETSFGGTTETCSITANRK